MIARPRAEILTIGDELLKGSTLNTNAQFLGGELTALGFSVQAQTSCPDRENTICMRLREIMARTDLVIVTGGLGPTPDDVTREAVAAYFKTPLKFSKRQYSLIVEYFRRRRKRIPACVRKEAMFPARAVPLENRFGIALGFYLHAGKGLVFVLPGVPKEQEKMFESLVKPVLKRHFPHVAARRSLIVKTVGLSEPEIMERLGRAFFKPDFDFGIYPYPGEAAIRIQSDSEAKILEIRKHMKRKMGRNIYAYEDISLSEAAGRLLNTRRETVSAAESCTGGEFAAEIVRTPGASRYFIGGIVAYQNLVKSRDLRVPHAILVKKGAVSKETAAAMADGIRRKFKTTYGVSITGIAGPEGGSPGSKPAGTVFIGLAGPRGVKTWKHFFRGDRGHVQRRSVQKALEYLWRTLATVPGPSGSGSLVPGHP